MPPRYGLGEMLVTVWGRDGRGGLQWGDAPLSAFTDATTAKRGPDLLAVPRLNASAKLPH